MKDRTKDRLVECAGCALLGAFLCYFVWLHNPPHEYMVPVYVACGLFVSCSCWAALTHKDGGK